jgi:hypothetical protein
MPQRGANLHGPHEPGVSGRCPSRRTRALAGAADQIRGQAMRALLLVRAYEILSLRLPCEREQMRLMAFLTQPP